MTLDLKNRVSFKIPGLCLSIAIIACSGVAAFALPIDYTLLTQKSFIGKITDFSYSGAVQNSGEIPVGSQVSGTYALGSYQSEPTNYLMETSSSIQGRSNSYSSQTNSAAWQQLSFSADLKDLHYAWLNGFTTDLFPLYFKSTTGADGGTVSFDIKNYASDNFLGTGTLYYEAYSTDSGLSSFNLAFTVEPVSPVPEPATILLLGVGLACLTVHGRKKIRN